MWPAKMVDMALYAQEDGTLKPRAIKSVDFVKAHAGQMIIADISADVRTALQNRYLNGWVYTKQICGKLNAAGITLPGGAMWTRDAIHAAMQECFLLKAEFIFNGKHTKVFESTADMSRKRFCRYIDEQIKPFVFGMWEIHIEDPKEGYWRDVYDEIMGRRNAAQNN